MMNTGGTGSDENAMTISADESCQDMMNYLYARKRNKFGLRVGFLLTGLLWFLSGSQISVSLFTTLEPPRFPDCSNAVSGRSVCLPDVPLSLGDCSSPHLWKRSGVSVISTFDVPVAGCESRPWMNTAWIHSALFAGLFVGAFFLAPLCDKVGRRPILTFGTLLLTFASFWSACSLSIYMYGVARFLVGIGCASSSLPSMVLLSELVPSTSRQYTVGVQALAFALSAIYVSALACVVPSWRVLTLLVTAPALIFCSGCLCCTGVYIESPKWLSSRGRMDEAFDIWLKIARINGVQVPDSLNLEAFTKMELQNSHDVQLKTQSDVDEELSLMSVQQMATPDTVSKAFRTFPLSVWLWVSVWMWLVAAFVYYGVLLDFSDVLNAALEPAEARGNSAETRGNSVYIAQAERPLAGIPSPKNGLLDLRHLQVEPPLDTLVNQGFDLGMPAAIPVAVSIPGADILSHELEMPSNMTASDKYRSGAYMEYLNKLGEYISDESQVLLEHARNLPQGAQKLYGEYNVDDKINSFYDDVSAQFKPSDPMAPFWLKARTQGFLVLSSFAAEIPAYVIGMYVASTKWAGRKYTTTMLYFLGGVCLLAGSSVQFWGLEQQSQTVS